MDRSWQVYVESLCSDLWSLSPQRIRRVIEDLDVLIATDQLSDMNVAGVLSRIGMRDPWIGEAARSIRATIRSGGLVN